MTKGRIFFSTALAVFWGGANNSGKDEKVFFFPPKTCFIHNINQVLPSDLKLGATKVTFENGLKK